MFLAAATSTRRNRISLVDLDTGTRWTLVIDGHRWDIAENAGDRFATGSVNQLQSATRSYWYATGGKSAGSAATRWAAIIACANRALAG